MGLGDPADQSNRDRRAAPERVPTLVGTEVELSGKPGAAVVVNYSGVSNAVIAAQLDRIAEPILAEMVRWARDTRAPARMGGLFDRDRYLSPRSVHQQMRTAREAMGDDVVSGVEESTEALVFSATSMFAKDEDEQEVWNQWAANVDLDSRLREMWMQTFMDSQCALLVLWGRESYSLSRSGPKGRPSRKQFRDLWMPTAMSVIDTLKVIPVGTMLFGRERYAYAADWDETLRFESLLAHRRGVAERLPFAPPYEPDDIVESLIVERYTPDRVEAQDIMNDGFDPQRLYLLRDGSCFRHHLTKRGDKRFADVRMRTVFELLDLKQQLHQMDRAHLIGGTNFIVLVTRGTDKVPALPAEIAELQSNVQVISRTPVMVGPHDLNVQIITPKLDATLNVDRYDVLDTRIAARLYLQFAPTAVDDADPLKQGRVVAQGLESRRLMMRRTFERALFRRIVRENAQFSGMPKMKFHPSQISLAFDPNWASFVLDQRQANELSRATLHGEFGFDQEEEAILRRREAEHYDDTFKTIVPHGGLTPNGADEDSPLAKKAAGRRMGGRKAGGGAAPGTGQGQPARRVRRKSDGNSKTEAGE